MHVPRRSEYQPVIEIQTSLCKKSRHHQRSRVVDQVNGEQYGAVPAGGNFQLTYPYGDTVAIFKPPSAAR
jgi:hypothetical protein